MPTIMRPPCFVLLFVLLILLPVVRSQVSPSEQLSEVMMLSMRLLNQFQNKFPAMATTFIDMQQGIRNFYSLGLTDEQISSQAIKIQQIDRMLMTLPSSAVSNAQYSKLISLLGFLTKLRTIFPGDQLQFQLSIRAHGNPGAMLDDAYPPLYNILYNLHRKNS